jgi:GH18 family chitinase
MKLASFLAVVCFFAGVPAPFAADPIATTPFHIAGYLPDYRMAEFSPNAARGLTDLIVFSAEPRADGTINLDRLKATPWSELATYKTRERVRLIVCVGGWGRSDHFAAVAGAESKRETFAKSVVELCLAKRLDGLDVDWEHPQNAAEETNYGQLLHELREQMKPHGLQLSMTVAAWQKLTPEAIAAVDCVNIMSYDHDGPHSTFEDAEKDVQTLRDAGVPVEKLVLGLPFYGRDLKKRDRTLTWRQIVERHHPAAEIDEVDGVHFNGPATIRRKVEYTKTQHLGGLMFWELGQDAAGEDSLLKVIRESQQ